MTDRKAGKRETTTINTAGWQSVLAPVPDGFDRCLFCGEPYTPDYSDPTDPLDSCADCHHDIRVFGGYISQPIFGDDLKARYEAGENIYRFASFLLIHERQLCEAEWASYRLEAQEDAVKRDWHGNPIPEDWPVCETCNGTGLVENIAACVAGDLDTECPDCDFGTCALCDEPLVTERQCEQECHDDCKRPYWRPGYD